MTYGIDALEKAIELAGSQQALAERIGVNQQRISYWLNSTTQKIPAEFAKPIEVAVSGQVTAHQIRPDIFTN